MWLTILFLITVFMLYGGIKSAKIVYSDQTEILKTANDQVKKMTSQERVAARVFGGFACGLTGIFWLIIVINTAHFAIALVGLLAIAIIALGFSDLSKSFETLVVKPTRKIHEYLTPLFAITLLCFLIELIQRVI